MIIQIEVKVDVLHRRVKADAGVHRPLCKYLDALQITAGASQQWSPASTVDGRHVERFAASKQLLEEVYISICKTRIRTSLEGPVCSSGSAFPSGAFH